jgi:putative acetyltransferase
MIADPVVLRRERAEDVDGIRAVQAAAFTQSSVAEEPVEAALVDALRASDEWIPQLSIVATSEGRVVGHVVCSRGWVDGRPALGLGPIGVLPELQGRAIGHALMHAVLGAADGLDEPVVCLLGSPDFYARFGFVRSTEVGIDPPNPAWAEHFQARPLTAFSNDLAGTFKYAAPFDVPVTHVE